MIFFVPYFIIALVLMIAMLVQEVCVCVCVRVFARKAWLLLLPHRIAKKKKKRKGRK